MMAATKFFVDTITGSSSNDGLTNLTPKATVAQGMTLLSADPTAAQVLYVNGIPRNDWITFTNLQNKVVMAWPITEGLPSGTGAIVRPWLTNRAVSGTWSTAGSSVYTNDTPIATGLTITAITYGYGGSGRISALTGGFYGLCERYADSTAVIAAASGTTGRVAYNSSTGVISGYFGGANPNSSGLEICYATVSAQKAAVLFSGCSNCQVIGFNIGPTPVGDTSQFAWGVRRENSPNCYLIDCNIHGWGNHGAGCIGGTGDSSNGGAINCNFYDGAPAGTHYCVHQNNTDGTLTNHVLSGCLFKSHRYLGITDAVLAKRADVAGRITASSIANPTVITSAAHGLLSGASITIAGSNSTPSTDGSRVVTVIDANTFSVPVNVTVAGTAGTWTGDMAANTQVPIYGHSNSGTTLGVGTVRATRCNFNNVEKVGNVFPAVFDNSVGTSLANRRTFSLYALQLDQCSIINYYQMNPCQHSGHTAFRRSAFTISSDLAAPTGFGAAGLFYRFVGDVSNSDGVGQTNMFLLFDCCTFVADLTGAVTRMFSGQTRTTGSRRLSFTNSSMLNTAASPTNNAIFDVAAEGVVYFETVGCILAHLNLLTTASGTPSRVMLFDSNVACEPAGTHNDNLYYNNGEYAHQAAFGVTAANWVANVDTSASVGTNVLASNPYSSNSTLALTTAAAALRRVTSTVIPSSTGINGYAYNGQFGANQGGILASAVVDSITGAGPISSSKVFAKRHFFRRLQLTRHIRR